MNLEIPSLLAYLVAAASSAAAFYVLFDQAEQALTEEGRRRISRWVLSVGDPESLQKGVASFAATIDLLVGPSSISAKGFTLSVIGSALTLLSAAAIIAAVNPGLYIFPSDVAAITALFLLIPLVITVNYLSFLETRFVLVKAAKSNRAIRIAVLLLVDAASSAALGLIPFLTLIALKLSVLDSWTFDWTLFVQNLVYGGLIIGDAPNSGPRLLPVYLICFVSVFFTSIWLYAYLVARMFVSILIITGLNTRALSPYIDFHNKPLKALGLMAMLLTIGGFGVMALVG